MSISISGKSSMLTTSTVISKSSMGAKSISKEISSSKKSSIDTSTVISSVSMSSKIISFTISSMMSVIISTV